MTRRDQILKLIVEHFIKTADPVGSKTLQETYGLAVSSATIRNEMASLEKDGYIEKAHVSGGRIPTEKGYQYYIDSLRSGGVDERAKNALQTVLGEEAKSIEEVMKESCLILSEMTSLASCVIGQNSEMERLVSIQVIPLSGSHTATGIFVTDKGHVESKTFLVDDKVRMEDVVKVVTLLNERLSGTPILQLVPKMEAMRPALTDYLVGQRAIFDAILGAFMSFAEDHLELFGKEELFSQPEFANDAKKLRELLHFLDRPERVKKAARKKGRGTGAVSVHLGGDDAPSDLALVSASISLPGEPDTALTILGPSRMDYDRVVSTLQYFAEELDRYFEKGRYLPAVRNVRKEKPCAEKPSRPRKPQPKKKAKK